MADLQALRQKFIGRFGESPEETRSFFAPGRVNLIGEHIDYNGGYVFPAALTFGTTMLIRKRDDRRIRFASENFGVSETIDLAQAENVEQHDWINYPKAVLAHLQKRGYLFGGYDVLYLGEIPNGAGLSSSASIQLVTEFGFMTMEEHAINRVELALVAQESENQFMGVQCGIMDQFSVAMGKKAHAILLKCNNLEYRLVPFESQGYQLVIGNTNKRRGLVDSEYNARRAQCERAVQYLKPKFEDLKLLCELSLDEYEASESLIPDETVRKRARHAIEENDRVLKSVKALEGKDLSGFGKLMIASHESLKNLYEVSCKELDVMVEEALKINGVLGSRMTGAGFGGCTVSLVHADKVNEFISKVGQAYAERTDFKADFYVAEIGDGAREI